jgi:hypothetical protein
VRAGVDGGILFIVIERRRLELPRKQIPPLFQAKEFSAQYQVNPDSDIGTLIGNVVSGGV